MQPGICELFAKILRMVTAGILGSNSENAMG